MKEAGISLSAARVYAAFRADPAAWRTAQAVAAAAGVAGRTARLACRKLATQGVLQRAATRPAHRYRLRETRQNGKQHRRLLEAVAVFGISMDGADRR